MHIGVSATAKTFSFQRVFFLQVIHSLLFLDGSQLDVDTSEWAQHNSSNQFGLEVWFCHQFVSLQGEGSYNFYFVQGKVLTNAVPGKEKQTVGWNAIGSNISLSVNQ